jgi:hypothetical protein
VRALAVVGAVLVLTGCESTVDQARKIAAKGILAFHQRGLTFVRVDKHVRVLGTAVVQDSNGTAVVVTLRNTGHTPLVDAPIAIVVRDRAGKTVFENNAPGLEPALVHVPLLMPGQVLDWVNDQVLPNGTPASVAALVGAGRHAGALPRIVISGIRLTTDPVSGDAASGLVHNVSSVGQDQLVLFVTARRGTRIVAAGRAIVPRLAAGKSTPFHAYFIGNPQGARISVSAPPSVVP